MTISPLRAAWLLIAAASWTTTQAANALSIPVNDLGLAIFERADTTSGCASGFSTCPGFTLPSDFCCSAGSVCNVLAGNTTLLCCPTGSSCTIINPITCDLSQQDPETHPEAPIKTTALNGVLTKCGSSTCCPFGYNCNGNNLCVMEVNQNAAPLQNVPTTTATKATTSTTSTKTSSTSTSTRAAGVQTTSTSDSSVTVAVYTGTMTASTTASPTSTGGSSGTTSSGVSESAVASADDKSKGTSTASIVGGVIGGLAGFLLIGAAVWFLCGRRLRKSGNTSGGSSRLGSSMKQRDPMNFMSDTNKLTRSTSSFGNIINNPLSISSPKPQGDATAFRTDFIRKLPSSGDYSRPVTPASSFGGGVGSSGDAASSTVGSVGYLTGRQQQQKSSPSPLSASLARDLPAPPSPSPPPLALRQARDSISVTPIRGMRTSAPRPQPSKHQPREPSTEEINVGVDPSIIGFGGNFTISPPGTLLPPIRTAAATAALASVTSNNNNNNSSSSSNGYTLTVPDAAQTRNRSNDRLTTFSSLLQAANLDPERPFVPNSVQSSPASRRR